MLGALVATPIWPASADMEPAISAARARALRGAEFLITSVIVQPKTLVMQVPAVIAGMETIAQRLKASREALHLSQAELATRAGVTQGTIGNIESGARKDPRELMAIAAAVGVSPHWLRSGRGLKTSIPITDNPAFPAVRGGRIRVTAGSSGFEVEYHGDDGEIAPLIFPASWYTDHGYRPESLVAIKVSGSAMEPTLYDGDLVVVNTAQTNARDGRVFVLVVGGEVIIRRLFEDGGWIVRSDNRDKARHADKRLRDDSLVIGEVVYRQSERI
jgi:phage repressor protein C with HTH and peptisase S24 domain